METTIQGLGFREVDGIWLWVYYNEIPIYPLFCLLKGAINPTASNPKP